MNKTAIFGFFAASLGGALLLNTVGGHAQDNLRSPVVGKIPVGGKIPTVNFTPDNSELAKQIGALSKRCDELEKENQALKIRLDKFELPTKLLLSGADKALTQLRKDFDGHTHVQAGYAPSGAIRLSGVGGTGEAVFFIGGFGDKNQSTGKAKYPGSK